ncbi:UPF0481 protein At3g47200-like [Elaeis guineensis]|uniref:UPF0481 protein At3g47200-like n=1 Tax=Elaeis guineensis var. tenera TaxID=51953 RepID=A0A6I9S858_ELAGV|nr:UPF0481 protein At3g47200-like [Elaeis guineensis]
MAETEGTRKEVLERKRVVMEEVTISSSWSVPVSGTCSAPLRGDSTKEWLISITNESTKKISATKPGVCKAPEFLRKDEKNAKSFEPEVVAIGPYHRGKTHLQPAEDHKRAAAHKFTLGSKHCIDEFYSKVKNEATRARACYADKFELMTDEEFTQMLFFDGCFVLHFISCYVEGDMKEVTMSTHLHGFIVRDMFLLENQLPYVVLYALMSLKSVKLDDFFNKIIGTVSIQSFSDPKEPSYHHLLDRLREKLLGPTKDPRQPVQLGPEDLHLFRSVKELREVGIKFRQSNSLYLRDIQFRPCAVWGTLSLPKIVIDDLARSRFLNMIALEMYLGSAGDYGITSFVWFLDCLIDRAEDVRELREEGILLNALGSDEQVAELFNELATNLAPDYRAYGDVLKGIRQHRDSKFKVSIYTFLHTHFSSPWTAIAFIAAVFLLVLSVIQTIFAVFPRS